MSQTYIWFRTNVQSQAERCLELFNKASGTQMTYMRANLNNDPPVQWGVPVGAGPDAGLNIGAAAIEAVRVSVVTGVNVLLTMEERDELNVMLGNAIPLENSWWYPPLEF